MELNSGFQLLFPVSSFSFSPSHPQPPGLGSCSLSNRRSSHLISAPVADAPPVQWLTLILPPALEAPSPWCGHRSPSHPLLGTAVRPAPHPPPPSPPPPPCLLYRLELSQGSSWGDLPLLLLDFCWGANARDMWGNSSEGPTSANCPQMGVLYL